MRRVTATTLAGLVAAAIGCGDNQPCDPALGMLCTIAGTGENGYTGEGGAALDARLSLPMDVIGGNVDGELFVLDWNNHRIRRIDPDGGIHFVAGNGELGGSIDDPATGALNHPSNLAWDPGRTRLYIAAWHNSKIMVLDPASGEIAERCGDGRRAYFGDNGPALTSSLDLPSAVAFSPQGDVIVLDQANQVIRRIDSTGAISLLAGRCVIDAPAPNGPGACAGGVAPVACPSPSGKFTCGDPATTCGKPCWPGYNGDNIAAADMRMSQVFGQAADPGGRMVFDRDGGLIFADVGSNIIRKIGTDGIVRRIAGTPPVDGATQKGYAGDGGPATDALLNHPVDLALADDGTLYFSDVFNHCIRAIAPDGTIGTAVGTCGKRGYKDGPPETALLNRPYGIDWVAPGTLYIADTGNSMIRAINLE